MGTLDALQFGPFTTAYHRKLVTDVFKDSARQFLVENVLPQIDHNIVEIDGALTPRATEDRNCGPHSGLKNCFSLDMRFFGQAETEYSELETQLWYRSDRSEFHVVKGSSLYVWTPKRRAERESWMAAIQHMMDSLLKGETISLYCPACFSDLSVRNTANCLDATCSNQCFRYRFRKDERGRLSYGCFEMREPPECRR